MVKPRDLVGNTEEEEEEEEEDGIGRILQLEGGIT